MDSAQADRAKAQLRTGVYARLSETDDAAESVPTQIEGGTDHAARRGWTVAAVVAIPCPAGGRRASSAPAFRMASRSWSVMGGWRVGVRRSAHVPSLSRRPCSRVYVQTRARGRDGTAGGANTHGDGSSVVRARQCPRLTWMARPSGRAADEEAWLRRAARSRERWPPGQRG
jgi:hypothetical protein